MANMCTNNHSQERFYVVVKFVQMQKFVYIVITTHLQKGFFL